MTRIPRGSTGLAQEATVPRDAVAVAAARQVSSQLGDETVILQLDDGVYYGLDPVGTRIWALLHEPRSVAEIRDRIIEEYEVDPERCERDLVRLLEDLLGRRLIELSE
jgi:hypothetical protein